jgi:tricorn protease
LRKIYACLLVASAFTPAWADPPLLLQHPSMSHDLIAFDYGGEIWTVPRAGGAASMLVAGQLRNSRPIFSPDGSRIAFTGEFDGNNAIYVVPAAGGNPVRLTWYPGRDVALGWTPDGKSVLFRSLRRSPRDLMQLYTVPAIGGAATAIKLPSGNEASYAPDGRHLAYTPFSQWQPAWKHYRGGQTSRIWIADLADSRATQIPRENSNDRDPMWVGDKIYFLSDRDGPVTLYKYDTESEQVTQLPVNQGGFDITAASAGPGGIVYAPFGGLAIYDFVNRTSHPVQVRINAELPQTRAHLAPVDAKEFLNAAITPSGKRVLLETHGDILSLPADKGEARNLTQTPGVADRDPAASPDGKKVAYFSDESGEYALHVRAASGLGPVQKFALGTPPSFFYAPRWSPDNTRIVFFDKRLNLWLLDVEHGGKLTHVDTDLFDSPNYKFNTGWSADSKWLVYSKQLPNHLHAAFVYSLEGGHATQITDGLSDVPAARFDPNGQLIYFISCTNDGPASAWLDLSSYGRPQAASVYAMVLRHDLPNPLPPENDEEGADTTDKASQAADTRKPDAKAKPEAGKETKADGGKETKADKPASVKIDFDGIEHRIVELPLPSANYTALETHQTGIVFVTSAPPVLTDQDYLDSEGSPPPEAITRLDMKSRKADTITEGTDSGSFQLSADGSHILFTRKGDLHVIKSEEKVKDGDGKLKVESAALWVDPRAEWAQMYHEAWRIERDFLYDAKAQGLDLPRAEKLYARFVPGLGGRQDLNVLLEEMTGHIGVGHTFIDGGALPKQSDAEIGLLGADYEADGDRYRFSRVLCGENFNPGLVAPLCQAGIDVHEGDLLLTVNGQEVRTDAEPYRAFIGLAGKPTVITVGPTADGRGAREITVVPVAKENMLRLRAWMEANRHKVDALSGGRLAYVYLPDTTVGGFANFNRYYFGQVGKQGVILDERFNHGGEIADYIIDKLNRHPEMLGSTREGADTIEPSSAIFGPRVMIINQMSGSGGDALPWMFHKDGLGPLVGVRTWGGLVGIGGYPELIDGGSITAPRWALYGTHGAWEVEDEGIPPDIEVVQDPALVRQGHDPQLERAVQVALYMLAQHPPPVYPKPKYPDRKPVLPE